MSKPLPGWVLMDDVKVAFSLQATHEFLLARKSLCLNFHRLQAPKGT